MCARRKHSLPLALCSVLYCFTRLPRSYIFQMDLHVNLLSFGFSFSTYEYVVKDKNQSWKIIKEFDFYFSSLCLHWYRKNISKPRLKRNEINIKYKFWMGRGTNDILHFFFLFSSFDIISTRKISLRMFVNEIQLRQAFYTEPECGVLHFFRILIIASL